MLISDHQQQRFRRYCEANPALLANRVVAGFFQDEARVGLLLKAMDGDPESRRELEQSFRRHFFRIRFMKYMVSTVKFAAIDQQRSCRRRDAVQPLLYDCPSTTEEGAPLLGELFQNSRDPSSAAASEEAVTDPETFHNSLTNEQLADAFASLTYKQKLVTTLCYALGYRDTEAAQMLGVSPQSISKTRRLALSKLRQAMTGRREGNGC
ncbi:sigma-70 RNA polymerase sigma factor region 4 domain-containing protein [Paenibacillus tarimensis]|uniref:hypothetical protein n=1 Tax=Paenibacillus tarimensis TaxID=416012 RepID=UPI001F16860F|nr:hypothetical protein [Paenibacillus tarimensis]MCF2945264.1 hypothetical protein [Paenibacillus tarimensis]